MHEIVMDIAVFAITVCGIIITRNVIPYIKDLIESSMYADIYDTVETAVKAAEQMCKAPKQGKTKKADVYCYVSHWLDERGIRLSEDDIDRMIEAAVFSMNNEV